jgi:hypothetical protein
MNITRRGSVYLACAGSVDPEVAKQLTPYPDKGPRIIKTADIDIRWPSGPLEHVENVAANQPVIIREGKGITPRQDLTGALSKGPVAK